MFILEPRKALEARLVPAVVLALELATTLFFASLSASAQTVPGKAMSAATGKAMSAATGKPMSVTGEDLSFLKPAVRDARVAGGGVTETGPSLEALTFWKGAPFEADLRDLAGPLHPSLAADTWTPVRLPARAVTEGGALSLRVFRAFTAFSTMRGLKTKSAIFPGEENFITDSYRVDSFASKRRVPDPEDREAPESATFTLYGKDALAGEVYYELRFESAPAWFRVTLRNLTTMRTFLLKLAEPGELLTVFYVIPAGDEVLLYGLTLAKTPLVPGTIGLERAMLANRMIAIGKWFAKNVADGH